MNTKTISIAAVVAALCMLWVQILEAQVRSPAERLEVIETARSLVYPDFNALEDLTDGVVSDPFFPRRDVIIPGNTTKSVLAPIASGISVEGTIEMGGVRYLLLQGRRVGPGDYLPVQHEGRTYQVRIEEVTATSYKLRLNDEEIEKNL